MKKTRIVEIIREEIQKVLSEKQINEMPYLTGEKGQDLKIALEDAVNDLKEKGLDSKQIASVLKSKKKRAELAPDFASALEDQFEKYGDDPNYNPDLGGPQTQRAVDQALGLSAPGKRGRRKKDEESPSLPTSEPQPKAPKGRPAGSKNMDLTSLISPTTPEEEMDVEVGSEDTEWYKGEEEELESGPSKKDIESSLRGLDLDNWDKFEDDEF